MADQNQQIVDAGDLRKYRIELPNLYDDADLDPYEFRLLAHYKRVGNCYESTKTTATKCKMSTGKVSEARDSLEAKGFIIIGEFVTEYDTLGITVADRWAENFAKYAAMKAERAARSQSEQGVHHMNDERSPGETKNEPSLGSTHTPAIPETPAPKRQALETLEQEFFKVGGTLAPAVIEKFYLVYDTNPDHPQERMAHAMAILREKRNIFRAIDAYREWLPPKLNPSPPFPRYQKPPAASHLKIRTD